jgi:hypothetical protein
MLPAVKAMAHGGKTVEAVREFLKLNGYMVERAAIARQMTDGPTLGHCSLPLTGAVPIPMARPTSIDDLPDDMLVVVTDMMRGRRNARSVQSMLQSFGYDMPETAIEQYADAHSADIAPTDTAGRLASAAMVLEAHTRIIRGQAIRIFRTLPESDKADMKTYVALSKLGIDGQKALIEALRSIPSGETDTDVTQALRDIERKLGVVTDDPPDQPVHAPVP